jgi:hypothetical protein
MTPEEKWIKAWTEANLPKKTRLSSRDLAYAQNDLEDESDETIAEYGYAQKEVRTGMKLFINTFGDKNE